MDCGGKRSATPLWFGQRLACWMSRAAEIPTRRDALLCPAPYTDYLLRLRSRAGLGLNTRDRPGVEPCPEGHPENSLALQRRVWRPQDFPSPRDGLEFGHVARQRRAGIPAQGQRSAALGKPPIIPTRPARAGAFSSVPKVTLIKCHLVAIQQRVTCALAGRKRRIGAGFPRAALRLPWAGLLRAFSAGAMGSRGITRIWSMSGSEVARGWMTENPCKVQALPAHSPKPPCPPSWLERRIPLPQTATPYF